MAIFSFFGKTNLSANISTFKLKNPNSETTLFSQTFQNTYDRPVKFMKMFFYPHPLREEHGSSDGLFCLFLLLLFLFHTSRALFILGTERFC